MTIPNASVATFVSADLYAQIQQFYARQMGLMDDRSPDQWADTFTEDAVFQEVSRMGPLHGREAIRTAARASAERHIAAGLQMRHWLGMIQVDLEPDGSVRSRCSDEAFGSISYEELVARRDRVQRAVLATVADAEAESA